MEQCSRLPGPGSLLEVKRAGIAAFAASSEHYDRTMLAHDMLAMAVESESRTLRATRRPVPQPGRGEVLVRVRACGVCRTDLHIIE
jgi:hypothetical protein